MTEHAHSDTPVPAGTASVTSIGDRLPDDAFMPNLGKAAAPPGHYLRIVLEEQHLSQAQLAARTGLSTKHVNQVIQGLAALSPDIALRLESAVGVPSHVWNTMEARYQDAQAREKARERLRQHVEWLKNFNVKELKTRKIVTEADPVGQVGELLNFFQVADPDACQRVWSGPVAAGFRRSKAFKVDPYATAVWLRLAERAAESLDLPPYSQDDFAAMLPGLRRLTFDDDSRSALRRLQDECRRAGVAVVFVEPVKGSVACGAARWPRSRNPMIVLSNRGKTADIFWFSFFHEAAHIVLHPKREMYIHDSGRGDDSDGLEAEADRAAVRYLIGPKVSSRIRRGLSHAQVRELAAEAEVHEGIIAGQVVHLTNEFVKYARLRRPIELPID